MAVADLFLILAFILFVLAATVGYVRSKAVDYIAIGLALATLALIIDRGAL